MRVAVTGTTGRVGAALVRHLSVSHEVVAIPRSEMDLADSGSVDRRLADLQCDVFLHPAGITSLEACEDDPRLAMKVNSAAAGRIALWAAAHGVRMVSFSTDYVFPGTRGVLHDESFATGPLNAYGRSKLAGERAVLTADPNHLVLRVSWVFGPEKPSFVDRVMDDALAGRPIAAVSDKLSLPTATCDLAGWVATLLDRPTGGVLHACQSGDPVTWHGLASFVVREMAKLGWIDSAPKVIPRALADEQSFRAARPPFSAMNNGRLATVIGEEPRLWQEALAEHVAERRAARPA